jgi:transcriptional regulator with XRE-family HTH domain
LVFTLAFRIGYVVAWHEMETKSRLHEKTFVPGTSRNRETGGTLIDLMAKRAEVELLEMGQRIAELRESHGYKQEWIADQVGVKLRTYQFWQQGKHPPTGDALEKLAELFGVTPRYILKGETPDLFAGQNEVAQRLDRIEAQLETLTTAVRLLAAQDLPRTRETAEPVMTERRGGSRRSSRG